MGERETPGEPSAESAGRPRPSRFRSPGFLAVLGMTLLVAALTVVAAYGPIERRMHGYSSGIDELPPPVSEPDAITAALRRSAALDRGVPAEGRPAIGLADLSGVVLERPAGTSGPATGSPAERPMGGVRVLLLEGLPLPQSASDPGLEGEFPVIGDDGHPDLLPGATLRETVSAADGSFRFDAVPAGPFCIAADTSAADGADGCGVFEPVVVPLQGGQIPVRLVAVPQDRPAELLVRARAPHGAGYTGRVVAFASPTPWSARYGRASRAVWATCDPLGVAALRGLAGPAAALWVVAEDGSAERGPVVPLPSRAGSDASAGVATAPPPVVSVATGFGVRPFAVRALDRATGDPLKGLRVLCEDLAGRRVAVTDEGGVAVFAIGPDPVLIVGGADRAGRRWTRTFAVPPAGQPGMDVHVAGTGVLEGVARAGAFDEDPGLPVPGVAILALRPASAPEGVRRRRAWDPVLVRTDAAGRFRIADAEAGTNAVHVLSHAFRRATSENFALISEEVVPGETARVLVELEPRAPDAAVYRGRIVAPDGSPAPAGTVVTVDAAPGPEQAAYGAGADLLRTVATAAPDGSFTCSVPATDARPGDVPRLTARSPHGRTVSVDLRSPTGTGPVPTYVLDERAGAEESPGPAGGGSMRLLVTRVGKPVAGAVVLAQVEGAAPTRTDLRGVCEIRGLPAGASVRVRAWDAQGAFDGVVTSAPPADAATIALIDPVTDGRAQSGTPTPEPPQAPGTLRVRVHGPDGQPIRRWSWSLTSRLPGFSSLRRTSARKTDEASWLDLPYAAHEAEVVELRIYQARDDSGALLPLRPTTVRVPHGVPELSVTPAPGTPAVLAGFVTDRHGRPVAGARILLWSSPVLESELRSTGPGGSSGPSRGFAAELRAVLETGDDGNFRATFVPGADVCWYVEAFHPTAGRAGVYAFEGEKEIALVVQPAGPPVTILVLDADGRPERGASVEIERRRGPSGELPATFRARTDAQGRAVFHHLPDGIPDSWYLHVYNCGGDDEKRDVDVFIDSWTPEDATIRAR